MKITTTIMFLEKGWYNDKSNTHIFKWMLVYYKYYILIELTFLKEFMSLKQMHQKSVIFVTNGIS